MKPATKTKFLFPDNQLYYYINPYDVEFIMFKTNALTVCSTWWIDSTKENNYIELVSQCNFDNFVTLFDINSLEQFESLTNSILLKEFKNGHTQICCSIDDPGNLYNLSFQIKNNELWATDNLYFSHKVSSALELSTEFMDYTIRQQLLNIRIKK